MTSDEHYPALEKLARRAGKRQVPYVQQLQWTDCGAACLAMVMKFWGRDVALDDVREAMGGGRDGIDAHTIVEGAEWFGMVGRGIKVAVDDLKYLPRATILHWEFNHFVVFERATSEGVQLVDPAFGRRFVPMERFRKSFTGIALLIEPTDTFEATGDRRSRVWSYLRRLLGERRVLSRVIVMSVLLRLFALALPILTALVVDGVVPRGDYHLLAVIAAGLSGVLVFQLLSELIRAHLVLQLRTNLDTRMTLGFLDHMVDLPYSFFQRRSAGDLMLRVNSNSTIREMLTSNTLSALLDGALVIVYLVLVFVLSATIGLIVLGLGALQLSIFLLARRRTRDLMTENLEAQARSQSYLVQLVGGIETLKVSGAEHRAVEHWSNLFADELNVALKRGRLGAVVDAFTVVLQAGSPLVVMSYGAIAVMRGDMSLGTMLAINALAVGFLMPLSSLVESALQLQELGSYIERIDDVLSTEREQNRDEVSRAPRLTGKIAVRDVSFRYAPQAPFVVRDLSLEIEPGHTIAIVGRSGSGKSTLAHLLLGLYSPVEGNILYDGRDLRSLDVRTVRRQLGIVPQTPFVFAGSIRENIAITDPTLPLERVVEAAKRAHIHDDIAVMPMSYETIVADGGASLSGGQRQRLAMARALVHNPAILLLDEATSALDSATEAAVMHSLDQMNCTRIVIAHQLSTIASADRIIVMDAGRVVQTGDHPTLMSNSGIYRQLVEAQTGHG